MIRLKPQQYPQFAKQFWKEQTRWEMTLDIAVSDEEMAARKAKWQPREPKVTTGYLARYASMVTSGNRGAILQIPGKND